MQSEIAREEWKTTIGYIASIWTGISWPGTIMAFAFMALWHGGGFFYFVWPILLLLVSIPALICEAGLGAMFRRSYPIAMSKLKYGRIWEFVGWFGCITAVMLAGVGFAAYIGFIGSYVPISATYGWGADPVSYFWGPYLTSLIPIISIAVVWIVAWLIISGGVAFIERVAIYSRYVLLILTIILIAMCAMVPNSWQGLATTFDPKPEALLLTSTWTFAVVYTFTRWTPGLGMFAAFASYLPKGGELNTSTILGGLLDNICIFIGAILTFSLTMGFGLPPTFGGSFGVMFAGLPQGWVKMPFGNVVAAIFYLTLYILGQCGLLPYIESLIAALMDKFGMSRRMAATVVIVPAALASLLAGLPFPDADYGSLGFRFFCMFSSGGMFTSTIAGALLPLAVLTSLDWQKFRGFLNGTSAIKLPSWFRLLIGTAFVISVSILFFPWGETVPDILALGPIAPIIYVLVTVVLAFVLWRRRG
jgi:NSS family neurotransmitter:Na+ symporter